MNKTHSNKIISVLSRLRFCIEISASVIQGISLFKNYTRFSLAIRNGDAGKEVLRSKKIHQVTIKSQDNPFVLNYRLQDIPLIFEIFQDEIYQVNCTPKETSHVLDLGANIGLSSIYFSAIYGSNTKIISVEPSRQNAEILDLNFNSRANITTVKAAISNTDGVSSFYDEGLGYNSRLDEIGNATYSVNTIRMQTLISEHSIRKIEILKIDIEGAEEIVFDGDIDWLYIVENIVIEIHRPEFADKLTRLLRAYKLLFVEKRDSVYLYSKR